MTEREALRFEVEQHRQTKRSLYNISAIASQLRNAISVGFKDEDEDDDGRVIGPVIVRFADGTSGRVEGGWYTRKESIEIARVLGLQWEEL